MLAVERGAQGRVTRLDGILSSDPPADPIADHRAYDRAGHGREQSDMSGAYHGSQGQQQYRRRNDKRHPDKGFRKSNQGGDGKDPIGMGLSGNCYPFACVAYKPVKKVEHALPVLVGGSSRPKGPHSGIGLAAPERDSFDIFSL